MNKKIDGKFRRFFYLQLLCNIKINPSKQSPNECCGDASDDCLEVKGEYRHYKACNRKDTNDYRNYSARLHRRF